MNNFSRGNRRKTNALEDAANINLEDVTEEDKRTITEWEKEFGLEVLDPDGFDRTDRKLYERLFTREEFEQGLIGSTIAFKPRNKK